MNGQLGISKNIVFASSAFLLTIRVGVHVRPSIQHCFPYLPGRLGFIPGTRHSNRIYPRSAVLFIA